MALAFKLVLLKDTAKKSRSLVGDVEINTSEMFFPQIEAESLQQNDKWLLQWYRVVGIKSLSSLSFDTPIYKILAVCASTLHWLSNL